MYRLQGIVDEILGNVVFIRQDIPECTCGKCPAPERASLTQGAIFETVADLEVGDKLETNEGGSRFYRVAEFTVDPAALQFETFLQGITGFGPEPLVRGSLN